MAAAAGSDSIARDPYLPRKDFTWLAVGGLVILALVVAVLIGAELVRPKPDPVAGAAAAAAMDRADATANEKRKAAQARPQVY